MDEKIIVWFETHQLIKVAGVEDEVGIPKGVLGKALKSERPLPEEYLPGLIEVIKKYGYGAVPVQRMAYVRY